MAYFCNMVLIVHVLDSSVLDVCVFLGSMALLHAVSTPNGCPFLAALVSAWVSFVRQEQQHGTQLVAVGAVYSGG